MQTSFVGDFPANPSVVQEKGKARKTNGGSGQNSIVSFAKLDQAGYWRRMSRNCCLRTLEGSLAEYCETWPKSGMMRSGRCYLQPSLERRISDEGYLLLPTPVANDDNRTPDAHLRMKARMKGGPRKKITSLNVMAKAGLLPTPTNTDSHGKSSKKWLDRKDKFSKLSDVIGGKLHPRFVEWMMGFPIGWTDLDALEMP